LSERKNTESVGAAWSTEVIPNPTAAMTSNLEAKAILEFVRETNLESVGAARRSNSHFGRVSCRDLEAEAIVEYERETTPRSVATARSTKAVVVRRPFF
jgi:hypothetical protein